MITIFYYYVKEKIVFVKKGRYIGKGFSDSGKKRTREGEGYRGKRGFLSKVRRSSLVYWSFNFKSSELQQSVLNFYM